MQTSANMAMSACMHVCTCLNSHVSLHTCIHTTHIETCMYMYTYTIERCVDMHVLEMNLIRWHKCQEIITNNIASNTHIRRKSFNTQEKVDYDISTYFLQTGRSFFRQLEF